MQRLDHKRQPEPPLSHTVTWRASSHGRSCREDVAGDLRADGPAAVRQALEAAGYQAAAIDQHARAGDAVCSEDF